MMNHLELSNRLKKVGDFVPNNARLADIGSDHAYLPVALMLQGKISFAVAGEVVKGPFEAATRQVAKDGLQESITVRLANGLDAVQLEDNISAVTIAGMGGALIRDILEAGVANQRLSGSERLILQPNVGEKTVRQWLQEHTYQIVDEAILEENKKTYEVIVAEKATKPVTYTEKELLFGPYLLVQDSEVFYNKWLHELKQRQHVINQMKQAQEVPEKRIKVLEKEIQTIMEVLNNGENS